MSKEGVELAAPGAASWAFTKNPDGSYTPNEPLFEVVGGDEERLSTILAALDEYDDEKRMNMIIEQITNTNIKQKYHQHFDSIFKKHLNNRKKFIEHKQRCLKNYEKVII